MLGAIIENIADSIYEAVPVRIKNFPLFSVYRCLPMLIITGGCYEKFNK
jgi:hypothetical protein